MRNIQPKALIFLLATAFLFSSCDKEEVITVAIDFDEPTAGEVVSDAADVHIHVHFTATGGELHDVEVILHPDNDASDQIIEFDGHEHAPEFVFMEDVNLSGYPSGTVFRLEAKACLDHDCADSEVGEITFSIP